MTYKKFFEEKKIERQKVKKTGSNWFQDCEPWGVSNCGAGPGAFSGRGACCSGTGLSPGAYRGWICLGNVANIGLLSTSVFTKVFLAFSWSWAVV